MASRSVLPPDDFFHQGQGREAGADRVQLYGLRRVVQAYVLSLLAAGLALPVVGAGLLTSNNCRIRGFDCVDRLAYGMVGAIVLATVAQLMLALHFRLGWSFWLGSSLIMSTALLNATSIPTVVGVLVVAPGVAAWVSEPPNRRHGVLAHWGPRYAALMAAVLTAVILGVST